MPKLRVGIIVAGLTFILALLVFSLVSPKAQTIQPRTLTKTVVLIGGPNNGNWDKQIQAASTDATGTWAFYGYYQMGSTWNNVAVLVRVEP